MPRKKKRREKTREYLENLLDKAGLKDKDLAEAIAKGVKSDNSFERTKALEIAAEWRGFSDAISKQNDTLETLPIGNISKENIERLVNKCAECKHCFEPKFSNKQMENAFIKISEQDNKTQENIRTDVDTQEINPEITPNVDENKPQETDNNQNSTQETQENDVLKDNNEQIS